MATAIYDMPADAEWAEELDWRLEPDPDNPDDDPELEARLENDDPDLPCSDYVKAMLGFDPDDEDWAGEELAENAFCKTGKGGGVDPTCGKGKRGAKLQDVKRGSKDYQLLSDAKKQQVLNRDIDFYTSVEMYTSVKSPKFKRMDPEKQVANRAIGALQGKARAYLDRAEAFDGSDRRMYQHVALGYFEQAQKIYDEVIQPKRKGKSR